MNKEAALKLLQDTIDAQPWIDQLNGYKELAKNQPVDVLGETYYALLHELHRALVEKDHKLMFVLTLALDAYCKLVLEANKPEAPAQA